VDLYTISTGVDSNRPNYPPSDWLEDWPLPILLDDEDSSTGRQFGLTAFPFLVVIGPDGLVAARVTGAVPVDAFQSVVDYYAQG